MGAHVLDAGQPTHARQRTRSRAADRPHLVLVPTGADAARAARSAQPPLRLTRLGRLVVAMLVAAGVSLLGVGLAGQLASATGEPHVITVRSGQTLSGIAAHELPDLSIGEGIVRLQMANGLNSTQIHTDQRLVIPSH